MIENDQLLQTTHFNANLIRATDHWAFLGMNHSWAHMGFFWKILWLRTNVNTFNYYALNFINSKCILMLIIFLKKTPKGKKKKTKLLETCHRLQNRSTQRGLIC